MEIFKQFRDTNYSVSDKGRVRNDKTGRIMKKSLHSNGYIRTQIQLNGKGKSLATHRMVAECFLPDYSEELQVNHKDSIKDNNKLENLEMVTAVENIRHAKRTQNAAMVKVHQYSKDGKTFIKEFRSVVEAAEQTGTSTTGISLVLTKKRKSAGGFFWKYGDTKSAELSISREIVQYSLDGKVLNIYKTIAEAARAIDRHYTTLWDCLIGRTKTCAGYKWGYKDDTDDNYIINN